MIPRTSDHDTSKTINPYKVLCNLLFKANDVLRFLTGIIVVDIAVASITWNHLSNFLDLLGFIFEVFTLNNRIVSFSSFCLLVFAKGDNLDWSYIENIL